MPRFAFPFLLIMLVVGCQTAGRAPQPTILVNSSQPATPAKKFWHRTVQFLQPLMPDRDQHSAKSDTYFAAVHSSSEILPINNTPYSLYQAGSIFPSQYLVHQNQADSVSIAEVVEKVNVAPESPNPLQIQAGDSEAFKSLLREIAIMPPEKRLVDDTRLSTLLTTFRDGIMNTDVEAEFLALLRRQILPESAPLPNAAKIAGFNRPLINPDEDLDDDHLTEILPTLRGQYPQHRQHAPPRNEEPIVAHSSMPIATPDYPDLVQLPGAMSGITQTSYQSRSTVPPASNLTGHGAGDWQAPTRVAIEQLRYAIEQTPNGRTVSNEMRLRMLEMLLGNKTEAARPMQSAEKAVNNFMAHQVLGFADLLDDSIRDNSSRHVSAAYRFNEGLTELQNLCPIKLKNVAFVDEFAGYGQTTPRKTQEFYPGENFLVYMEIEHPTVRRITDGFDASIKISYEIRDAHANSVARKDLGPGGDRSHSRKRDYALAFPGTLPTSLAPGQYQLRINVTDLNDDSMQYAEEQIQLQVAPSMATGR